MKKEKSTAEGATDNGGDCTNKSNVATENAMEEARIKSSWMWRPETEAGDRAGSNVVLDIVDNPSREDVRKADSRIRQPANS